MRRAAAILAALAAVAGGSGTALAAPRCAVPAHLSDRVLRPGPVRPPPREAARRTAISGYLLALSWSPEFCRSARTADSLQCSGALGRFGFILHGLWPEGARSDPRWCRAVPPPPPATVRATLCATPSPQLIAREWAKHGSCVTRSADAYFAAARRLFAAVRPPDMAALSRARADAGTIRRAFAAANPGLSPDAVALAVNPRGWLEEVRLCLDTRFRPRRCEAGDRGPGNARPVAIWRGGPAG